MGPMLYGETVPTRLATTPYCRPGEYCFDTN